MEKSNKLNNALGSHLVIGPRVPPAYMVDAPMAPKVNGKWVVAGGLETLHENLPVLLRDATALDVSITGQPWANCTRVSCKESVQGKKGVLGLELELSPGDKQVVVIKSASEGAQETFSALLAEVLDVRCARIRVLDSTSGEYDELKSAVSHLLQSDEYQHAKIVSTYLALKQLLVMEAAVRCVPLKEIGAGLTLDMLYELGLLMSLDMLLANGDRLPCTGLWDRPGNTENILFRVNADSSSVTFGIDQVCVHPGDADIRRDYMSRLVTLLASMDVLTEAIGVTITFLEHEVGSSLPRGAAHVIAKGIRQGISRASKLSRKTLVNLLSRVRNMVPEDGNRALWDESLGQISVEFMCDVVTVFQSCGVNRVQFKREEGPGGLARIVTEAREMNMSSSATVELFFDFDRTLTNGLASSGDLPLDKRVRGGAQSVAALNAMKEAGLPAHIITARSPRKVVVDQLVASIRGPQRELGEIFLSLEQFQRKAEPQTEETTFCGHQLAFATDAPFYASDYEKPAAVAHALCRRYDKSDDKHAICVLFVDDVAMNAHDVGTRLGQMLLDAGRADLEARVIVQAVWWDTILEDAVALPSMLPEFGKTEQGYQDFMVTQLLDFGITSAETKRRRGLYTAQEMASGRPTKAPETQSTGKLKAPSQAQKKLADFLFGGGKRR
mmetsp:Transcript_17561/g.29895  ORF Transcript_17561/g.29895 Transcript_17561/m.29895 type:complete len:670 (-) Transcript_17561:741-2750(-)|eukprot:CAMPEP_0203761040 /NCGR_PEP_ID=MMETSP0098-20131031/14214_1 /ASSEMBLY_ACC=CAM_ASM_000208 /TAXON_ID=96639 /ORGANISM=" , Strain NY0313808BC1" /LENGTH=669 /DNA_ID=CAMNT_0050654861 /DNA_START=159 /DNA_END=2168 /DNA_ORIENTATION=-